MAPKITDVFKDPARRKEVDALKPNNVEEDDVVKRLSKAYGSVERGLNEAKAIVEDIPEIDHELAYRMLDQLADHAYESWRHLIYDEPMVRWVRSK